MFQCVRLVDYLNARRLLNDLAGYLGTRSSLIEASNVKHIVRHRIRNAHRWAKFHHRRQGLVATHCRICRMGLIPDPPRLPSTYQLPCCEAVIHSECRMNWAMCPLCNVAYTALKCCVCVLKTLSQGLTSSSHGRSRDYTRHHVAIVICMKNVCQTWASVQLDSKAGRQYVLYALAL